MREILGLVQPLPIFLYRFGSKQGYHFKANQSRLFKHKVDVNHRALETPFTLALLKKKKSSTRLGQQDSNYGKPSEAGL